MLKRKIDDKSITKTLLKKHKAVDKKWPDEMTPEWAKEVEKMREKMYKDNEARRKSMQEAQKDDPYLDRLFNKKKKTFDMKLPEETPLTVEEVKRLEKMRDEMEEESKKYRMSQDEIRREIEKQHQPVVKAIREQTELLRQIPPVKEKIYLTRREPRAVGKDKFRPRVYSTPSRPSLEITQVEKVVPMEEAINQPLSESEEITQVEKVVPMEEAINQPLPESEDENVFDTPPPPYDDFLQNSSIRTFTENEPIGDIAREHLNSGNDRIYGVYYNFDREKLAIGSQTISIENNDIILDNTKDRYEGTNGLWILLTKSEIYGIRSTSAVGAREKLISRGVFTQKDFNNYKDILIKTYAMYQNNDPMRKPKSNIGWKWKNLISEVWKEMRGQKAIPSGSGFMVNTDCPVEFRPVGSFQDLIDRMKLIRAEEHAGNSNSHNDIAAIRDFIKDREQEISTLKELLGEENPSGGQIENNWWPRKRVKKFDYYGLL